MAASIPTTEPASLRAGDTWQWRREDLSDYPAPTWVLKYFFRNATAFFDVIAAASGTAHAVTVARATTAALASGRYTWVAVVETATERFQVDTGTVEILPDLAAAVAVDARSFARKMLDAIDAELVSRGSSGQLDLINATLDQRSIQRDAGGLIALRSQFAAQVKREESTANGVDSRRVLVRFG